MHGRDFADVLLKSGGGGGGGGGEVCSTADGLFDCWMIAHLAELEQNAVLMVGHKLEVLHRGLSDPATEVEAISAQLVIPPWRLVVQGDDVI